MGLPGNTLVYSSYKYLFSLNKVQSVLPQKIQNAATLFVDFPN